MNLSKRALLDLIIRSVEEAGWQVLVASADKPFGLRLYRGEERGPSLRVFIWNCTHGGGSARAVDEYRIQLTGVVPDDAAGTLNLLLGWHSGYEVFAAWDIARHNGQDSSSPSAQIREELLAQAHAKKFAVGTRGNGELVVAFRPEFLVDYALSARSLHRVGHEEAFGLLNELESLSDDDVVAIDQPERQRVISTIVRRYRASDFRRRILGAYNHRCAMCGVQLELIEAAHIVPVASDQSTDDTANGIALCALHHLAFDKNLISFNETYRIEVSDRELQRLSQSGRAGGSEDFRAGLKAALVMPNDRRDYPPASLIRVARLVRNWNP